MFKKIFLSLVVLVVSLTHAETQYKAIIPFTPGGGADITFRQFQKYAQQRGVNVVAEYRSGADGLIGMNEVATSTDNITIGFGTIGTVAVHRAKNPTYQFEYVTLIRSSIFSLVSNPKSIQSLDEFDAELRKVDTKKNFGFGSPGQKITFEQLFSLTAPVTGRREPTLVAYKGSSQLLTDLIGGFIDVAWIPINVTKPMIDSGKVKLLAANMRKNAGEFSGIPKMNQKYPGLENTDGFCVVLPKGASAESITFWSSLLREYMSDPHTIKSAADDFTEVSDFGPAPLKTAVDSLSKAYK